MQDNKDNTNNNIGDGKMRFILPVVMLGSVIVFVLIDVYMTFRIWTSKTEESDKKPVVVNKMTQEKRNTMYNLENMKLAAKRRATK